MNVLSLCNGMSCGMIALEMLGVKVNKYYSSEIDKYANQVTQAMYPEVIQLGDITKWREWELDDIDLILAGTPCTGFSFAGKGLNFDDPQSKLFFDFIDILKHHKPKHFLLENVAMLKEHSNVISSMIGEIYPDRVTQLDMFSPGMLDYVEINSALLSAQNRVRWYWANFDITQPEDKGILLRDILDYSVEKKLSNKEMNYMQKSNPKWSNGKKRLDIYGTTEEQKALCLTANMHKGVPYGIVGCIQVGKADLKGHDYNRRVYSENGKSPSLAACSGGNLEPKVEINFIPTIKEYGEIYPLKNQISIIQKPRGCNKGGVKALNGKTPCLSSNSWQDNNHLSKNGLVWRKLTPRECGRLQTVPEDKLDIMLSCGVSNSQLYKIFGNGWTCEVIAHILKSITP